MINRHLAGLKVVPNVAFPELRQCPLWARSPGQTSPRGGPWHRKVVAWPDRVVWWAIPTVAPRRLVGTFA